MKSEKQAIIFMRPMWTEAMAKQYLKKHNLKPIAPMRRLGNEMRYRLTDPKKYDHFTTLKSGLAMDIILGWY